MSLAQRMVYAKVDIFGIQNSTISSAKKTVAATQLYCISIHCAKSEGNPINHYQVIRPKCLNFMLTSVPLTLLRITKDNR